MSWKISRQLAENELTRIASILCWEKGFQIKEQKITSIEYSNVEGNQNAIVIADMLYLKDHLSMKLTMGEETSNELTQKLLSPLESQEFDLLLMWKEAISQDSPSLEFLLHYRILEHLCSGKVDDYIKQQNPKVEMVQDRGPITVFRYLRDNIHSKKPQFPFKKMKELLPSLRKLSEVAIKTIVLKNL
jgi:hypothetical protein